MGTHATCIFHPKTLYSSEELLCIPESANQVTGAALCLQDFSMSPGRWMQGGEQPLPPSSAKSVRDKPVTCPACPGEEPTDRTYCWEINGKPQGSEAEHPWKPSHSTHKKWSMLLKYMCGVLEKLPLPSPWESILQQRNLSVQSHELPLVRTAWRLWPRRRV